MKKLLLGLLALPLFFASCGSSMTAEQIDAEAKKKFDDAQATIKEQATADCDDNMDQYVTMYVDSLEKAKIAVDIPTMDNE